MIGEMIVVVVFVVLLIWVLGNNFLLCVWLFWKLLYYFWVVVSDVFELLLG